MCRVRGSSGIFSRSTIYNVRNEASESSAYSHHLERFQTHCRSFFPLDRLSILQFYPEVNFHNVFSRSERTELFFLTHHLVSFLRHSSFSVCCVVEIVYVSARQSTTVLGSRTLEEFMPKDAVPKIRVFTQMFTFAACPYIPFSCEKHAC